jgi:hypothetical protein
VTRADRQVYGDPVVTANGDTVVPVSRHGLFGTVRPVGVFLVHDGAVTWSAATDTTRVLLLAEVIGLATAVIGTLAVLRRPPWPELTPPGLEALAKVQAARSRRR